MKRIVVIALALLLVGFIGFRACQNYQAKQALLNQKPPAKIVPVRIQPPANRLIVETIRAAATIQADFEIAIYSKVSGKIARNLVRMGSPVAPGTVVSVVNRDEVGYQFNPFEVKSDVRGVVARVLQNSGAMINPSIPLMSVVDIDQVKAVAAVDEMKIRFVKVGQEARIAIQAYPGESFAAKVSNISPVCNPLNRAIDVEVSMANPGHRLKPGMYAEVELTQSSRPALVVPIAAVVDRSGQKVVFVAAAGRVVMTPVVTGAVQKDAIEIVSGLSGGEQVVVSGAEKLEDHDQVNVIAR